MKSILIIFFLTFTLYGSQQTVKIGVLAFHSKAETAKEWAATAEYLNQMELEYTFTILPLTYPEMNEAVKSHENIK